MREGEGATVEHRTSTQLIQWMRSTINSATMQGAKRAVRQAKKAELADGLEAVDPGLNDLWLKRALGHRKDRRPAAVPLAVVDVIGEVCGGDIETGRLLWHQAATDELLAGPRLTRRPRVMRGRRKEWQEVLAAASATLALPPQSATLLVVGDAGFGKTMLLDAIRAWAVQSYADLLEIDVSLPGLAGVEQLLGLTPPAPVAGSRVSGQDVEAALQQRIVAIEEALYERARAGLTVLLVDDIQRADPRLRQLLSRFAARRLDQPMLTVIASRRREDPDGELARLIALDQVKTIDVGPLDRRDMGEIVADHAKQLHVEEQQELLRAVMAATRGDPAGAVLLLEEFLDRGSWRSGLDLEVLRRGGSRSTIDRWRQRIDQLSPDAHELVQAAAVAGLTVDTRVLRRLPHLEERADRVASAVNQAVEAEVLRWVDTGPATCSFLHEYARDAALDSLPTPVTAELHHQLAEVLESGTGILAEPDELTRALAVFEHRVAAGDLIDDQVPLAEAGLALAELALAVFDADTAVPALRVGLAALDDHPAADVWRLRADLLRLLASGPIAWAEREALLLEALELLETHGDDDVLLATVACDLSHLSPYGIQAPVITSAMERTTQRLDGDHTGLHASVAARLATHLVWCAQPEPSLERADALSRAALDEAAATADDAVIALALDARAIVLMALPDVAAMVDVTRRMRRVGPPSWLELVALLRVGDRAAFDVALEEFRETPLLPRWFRDAFSHQFAALLALIDGDLADAIAEADLVASPYEGIDDDFDHGQGAVLIWERHLAGDAATARSLSTFALELFPDISGYQAAHAFLNLAPGGDRALAKRMAEDLLRAPHTHWGHEHSALVGYGLLAEVLADLDLDDHAAVVYEWLLPHTGQLIVLGPGTFCLGAVDRFLGMLAPRLPAGELSSVHRHFEAAEALEDAFGAPALVAATTYWHGRTLAAFGEPEDQEAATALLEDAEELTPPQMLGLHQAIDRELRRVKRRR